VEPPADVRADPTTSCEYTDEIEIDAGILTPAVRLFATGLFALRQARWRQLAAVLA
jgi:hypothetical protein